MPPSPMNDGSRSPLDGAWLSRSVVAAGGVWREIRVVDEVASSNAELVAAARAGAAEGAVLAAEWQTAGRGRLGRAWAAPPRSALTFSVLLRPSEVPAEAWVWLPHLAGLAVVTAVGRLTRLDVRLKWPNDVLVGDRKLAGILVERVDDGAAAAAVVGVGLNVSLELSELPVTTATSLTVEGVAVDREPLLVEVLQELGRWYSDWRTADGDPEACGLRAGYRGRCATLGRRVRAHLPGGAVYEGRAVDVDIHGRLVITGPEGTRALAAADVVHLR